MAVGVTHLFGLFDIAIHLRDLIQGLADVDDFDFTVAILLHAEGDWNLHLMAYANHVTSRLTCFVFRPRRRL